MVKKQNDFLTNIEKNNYSFGVFTFSTIEYIHNTN